MKRAPIAQYAILAVCLLALIALAAGAHANEAAHFSFYSTYDIGPNGYRALYDVLQREGVPVERAENDLGLLDRRVRTLVLSSNATDQIAGFGASLDDADAQRLERFMRRGGRLVILDGGSPSFSAVFTRLRLPLPPSAPDATVLARIAPVAMTSGVGRVFANSDARYRFENVRGAIPLLGTSGGVAALLKPYGKGSLLVITDPDVWSNAMLGRGDNARFAYNALASQVPIAFDERIHGYAVDRSFWVALPTPVHVAVWLVVAMLLLWLAAENLRMAPAVPVDLPDERDSSSYIASMAALLRRARAGAATVERFAADAIRRGALRRNRAGVDAALTELEGLRVLRRPPDAALLRAAQLYAQLRKDLE